MVAPYNDPSYGDVSFTLPATLVTSGVTTVVTTGGYFYGMIVHVISGYAEVFAYDNASTATGLTLGIECASAAVSQAPHLDIARYEHYTPVKFKKGITVSVTGTADAIMFYSPKG